MNKRNLTCCFTGHRRISDDQRFKLKKHLVKEIVNLIQQGVKYYGSGGATGFDLLAGETVVELKKDYPQIRLILVLPCRNQDRYWSPFAQKRLSSLKRKADKVVYVSEAYFNGCMQKRNRHLVDCSGYCICYLEKSSGGTADTVNYARQKGLRIVNLCSLY